MPATTPKPRSKPVAQVKRIRRPVDGIILLDKPRGFSSNAALQKVRWLLNAEKAGHTGSLDPLATGVLPLCFGEATKFSQYLLDADKGYETLMQLGVTTTTADAEGEVLERRPVTVGRADIEALLPRFRGEISQIPPMYSALKRDGQPLYKLARAGEVVEREPRSVTIARLELLSCEAEQARLAVDCTKGTYIRTLVEDIGHLLGCGAHVAELRRTKAGPFTLAQTVSLEALEQAHAEGGHEAVDRFLLPVDSGLQHWPLLQFSEHSSFYWLQGQPVRAPEAPKFGMVRVQDHNGRFIGIGEVSEDGRIAPRRLIRSA
jgi:tRNA pseudouridine55 synthase